MDYENFPNGEIVNEIMRIQIYGMKYGFVDPDGKKSEYIIRKLKQAQIPHSRMVELNQATNQTELIQKGGDLISEYYGTKLAPDGSLSLVKLGEINHSQYGELYWRRNWRKVFEWILEEGANEVLERFFEMFKWVPRPVHDPEPFRPSKPPEADVPPDPVPPVPTPPDPPIATSY